MFSVPAGRLQTIQQTCMANTRQSILPSLSIRAVVMLVGPLRSNHTDSKGQMPDPAR